MPKPSAECDLCHRLYMFKELTEIDLPDYQGIYLLCDRCWTGADISSGGEECGTITEPRVNTGLTPPKT